MQLFEVLKATLAHNLFVNISAVNQIDFDWQLFLSNCVLCSIFSNFVPLCLMRLLYCSSHAFFNKWIRNEQIQN